MKNATLYKRKIKSLLRGLRKFRAVAEARDDDPINLIINSILREDASRKRAEKAQAALKEEFVDFNELRVALPREVVECIGHDYPNVRGKAEMLKVTLNNIFSRFNRLSIDPLADVPKKALRRRLEELGLSSYAAACVAMFGFGVPGVPADDSLARCLEINGCVEQGSSLGEVQTFLDHAIAQRDAPAAHAFFRAYVEKNAKALAKKRAAEAKARAAAEAKAKAEWEAAEAAKAKKLAVGKAAQKRKARKAKGAKKTQKLKETRRKAKPVRKASKRKPAARRSAAFRKTTAAKSKAGRAGKKK